MQNKENQEKSILFELNKRLGVVISLLLRMTPVGGKILTLKGQVKVLSDLGVRPKDIADILGRTQTHITKELATLRKYEKIKKETKKK